MDFDYQWFLLGLPIAFAFGWLASRFDLRQWKRDQRDSPKAYFKGLNLLLNEQQDKAIDAFIEAVQQDPDTSDLHFALGNLFRRRGEYERAVRVHQHLLARGDLNAAERDRARYAMAQDFLKAGLIDRAEAA
jgi:lipopolysaccharide assembly protein B